MAEQTWFVVRDGREEGPYSGTALKEMAASGKLRPDDQVRRGDVETVRRAKDIKGLFPAPPPSPADPDRPARKSGDGDEAQRAAAKRKKVVLLASGVGLCFVMCCGGFGALFLFGSRQQEATKRELAEADRLWDSGDKAGAAAKYRTIIEDPLRIGYVKDDQRPRVYGRVIDFDVEAGNEVSAKKLIRQAGERNVAPAVNSPQGRRLAEAVAAERKEAERKEKAKTGTPRERLEAAKWDDVEPALALYNQFNGNEVAADAKFKGKTIMVEGEVGTVKRGDAFSSTRIILVRQGGANIVYCDLSGSSAKSEDVAKLQPGSWVRVIGKCKGKAPSGTVEMTDCDFIIVNR